MSTSRDDLVTTGLRLRPAVRVLLADPADRVLMVRWAFPAGGEEWIYLARVGAFEPRGALTEEELAAEGVAEVRWMTVSELGG